MKKCFPVTGLSGILLVFSGSCKKSHTPANYSDVITGSWELRYTDGGMLASRTWAPGNQHIISFSQTDYSISSNGQLSDSGHYSLVRDGAVEEVICNPSLQPDQYEKLTYIHPSYSSDVYIKISGNLLEVYSGCEAADGSYAKYERTQSSVSLQ